MRDVAADVERVRAYLHPDLHRTLAALDWLAALASEADSLRKELTVAKQDWWDQRNEWVKATGINMDRMVVLEIRAEKAEAEAAALREALEFYADTDHWMEQRVEPMEAHEFVTPAVEDMGDIARAALTDLEAQA